VGQFGSYGTADGQFLEPIDLDVGPDGSVYVVDDVRDDIQRFTADGKHIQTIGRHGTGDGELQFTGSIVVADDGTLLDADWDDNRVQAWDADGQFLWSVGSRGSGPGEFRLPGDVAADGSGRWFATDFENGRVQAFGPDNEPLGEWVVPAVDETGPAYAITAAGDDRLYVNMPFGDRIAVLEYLGS
jgi:tripartite motif-containing protein 71